MPFELGIFFGAKHLGDEKHHNKNALVLERTQYSVQQMVSDLNGIEAYAHRNRVPLVMHTVRDWLRTNSRRKTIPGHLTIDRQYLQFRRRLPAIADQLGFDVDEIPYADLVNIIEDSVAVQLDQVN